MDEASLQEMKTHVKRATITAARERLDEIRTLFQGLTAPVKLDRKIAQLAHITDGLRAVATSLPRDHRDSKSRLQAMHNKVVSLSDGLQAASYTVNDLNRCRLACMRNLLDISSVMEAQANRPEKISQEAADSSGDSAKLDRLLKGADSVIHDFSKSGSQLILLKTKPFIYVQLPVIPISNPPLIPSALNDVGIKARPIGTYPVLEKQLCLGINPSFIDQMKRAKKTSDQVADFLVDLLEEKSRQKYLRVGGVVMYKGGYYYWLVRQSDYDAMRNSTRMKALTIKEWGFAFS